MIVKFALEETSVILSPRLTGEMVAFIVLAEDPDIPNNLLTVT